MYKKLLLIITLAITLTMFLFPAAVVASSNTDIDAAKKSAQNWLYEIAATNPEIPQWQGARITSPQPYQSLEGEINAFMFAVDGEKGVVGHILTGNSQYGYDVLEAGTSAPPAVPMPNDILKAIEVLGLKTDEAGIGVPIKLVYTGVDGYYALYSIQDQLVAINLIFKNAILVSDIKPNMPSPLEYQAAKKATGESKSGSVILSTGYYYLPMYYWNGPGRGWCGPCSGVSIGTYYRNYKGYSSLPTQANMYDYLYYSMETYLNGGATYPWDYGPGFISMTQAYGYYNFTWANDYIVTHGDFWPLVDGINSGWPTALLITQQMHWRAIKGYSYNTDTNYYYIICTNSQTSDSWEYLNWDNLGLGLVTCRIKN